MATTNTENFNDFFNQFHDEAVKKSTPKKRTTWEKKEYISAFKSTRVNQNLSKPVFVSEVSFEPIKGSFTKDLSVFQEQAKTLEGKQSFYTLLTKSNTLYSLLQSTEAFSTISFLYDVDPSNPENIRLKLKLEEGPFRGRTTLGVMFGSEGTSFKIGTFLRSPRKSYERLILDVDVNPQQGNNLSAYYQNPYIYHKDGNIQKIDTNIGAFMGNSTLLGRYKFEQRGVKVGLSNSQHDVTWQVARRTLPWAEKYPSSLSVFEGDSTKSSLRYKFNVDWRDSKVFPTFGKSFVAEAEYAGLGGDVHYVKGEGSGQLNIPLGYPELSLNFYARCGAIVPLASNSNDKTPDVKNVHLVDRFFLGANFPFVNVRGFEYVGPRDNSEPIGADVHYSAGAHLTFPISSNWGSTGPQTDWLKGHAFYNLGNSFLQNGKGSQQEQPVRQVVGIGFLLNISDIARMEFNAGYPLSFHEQDKPKKIPSSDHYEFWSLNFFTRENK